MEVKKSFSLSNYNPSWPTDFRQERKIILSFLPKIIDVHIVHIGSTAVEGAVSRPIIDIAIGVMNPLDLITVRDSLSANGYLFSSKGSSINHFVMGKRVDGIIKFIIHIVKYNGIVYRQMANFVKKLKNNYSLIKEYNDLKIRLHNEKASLKEYSHQKRYFEKVHFTKYS
ncbi:MAG: GrpB family protein [Bacilli bacterium]